MSMDFYVRDFRLNRRHVAGYALASRAALFVMRVLFEGCCSRAVRRERPVAVEADGVGRLSELGVIACAVYVVTIGTGDTPTIHDALHEIVSLHAILVRCAIGKVCKGRFSECVFLEPPEIGEVPA